MYFIVISSYKRHYAVPVRTAVCLKMDPRVPNM